MAQISPKLRSVKSPTWSGVSFFCPGCEEMHTVRTAGDAAWQWDGNKDAPTFSPSVLVTSGHFVSADSCWCKYNAANPDKPAPFKCYRCHSFVKAGMIQFLGDCSHSLAGQTVPIPDLPDFLDLA